ncbi:MAG: alanyl-tRNA editing protein [Candidatus Thorarchaeota archaeon]|nr:alanyl-tRNA editing protein [Candidatus Thorarchaeota archaeon]
MTELLHMKDNYLREFDATVLESTPSYIVLDRTAFYPEGGGQPGDRGRLLQGATELHVIDTRRQEGQVRHIIEGSRPLSASTTVRGVVDWSWRYECMRYHTAQHVLSRFMQVEHGLETVGNQIRPGESRADFSPINDIPDTLKSQIEASVNEILSRGLPVRIQFMPRAEAVSYLQEHGYQSRYLEMVPAHVREFRIVTIGDWDASSCAGTHVANTSEIGRMRLGKTKNVGAGKQRIYFTLST